MYRPVIAAALTCVRVSGLHGFQRERELACACAQGALELIDAHLLYAYAHLLYAMQPTELHFKKQVPANST